MFPNALEQRGFPAVGFGGTFAAGLSPSGFALKVLVHGVVGGVTSALGGGRFGHGFASGGFTALRSGPNNSRFIDGLGFSPLRVAIGAAIGGTASRITGGKFANGAITGAFSQALNNERSEVRVIVEDPYTTPPSSEAETVVVTEAEQRKAYGDSPHRRSRVRNPQRAEIKSVLDSAAFDGEADRIWDDSYGQQRETGALRVYDKDGVYRVYSVGTPDPDVANRMTVEPVDPSLGRHVFDWHPHPGKNINPSPADLRHSYNTGVPGAIRWSHHRPETIYRGVCKGGRTC